MNISEKVYNFSPVFIQNILCSFKGYLICRKRYNENFHRQLSLFEGRNYTSAILLKDFLIKIQTVPYYKKIFDQYDFDLDVRDIYTELLKLPILTKESVKSNLSDIVNPYYPGDVYLSHTSGTTGGGLVFPTSREMENRQWAIWWRYRRWHGINMDTWCGWFGGRTIISTKSKNPPFWRINCPCKQVMFSAYHLNTLTVNAYYHKLMDKKLTWLHGYPSQISFFSALILDAGFAPLDFITHITFGSENLLENQIRLIKSVFPNAKLTQHYGLSEGVANLSQDVTGNWVVDDDFAYVEFIPVSETDTSICRIVGTGFSNEAFPLVRYDTGDIAHIRILKDGNVRVLSIDGRKEDFVELPNGVKLGRLDHIFKDLVNIQEAQIYQKNLYEIDFRIVKGQSYSMEDERLLWQEIRDRINESVQINIYYLDKIPRTKSGKLRLVISDIK